MAAVPKEQKINDFFVGFFAAMKAWPDTERDQTKLEHRLVDHLMEKYGMLRVSAEVEAKERFKTFLWEEVQKIESERNSHGR